MKSLRKTLAVVTMVLLLTTAALGDSGTHTPPSTPTNPGGGGGGSITTTDGETESTLELISVEQLQAEDTFDYWIAQTQVLITTILALT